MDTLIGLDRHRGATRFGLAITLVLLIALAGALSHWLSQSPPDQSADRQPAAAEQARGTRAAAAGQVADEDMGARSTRVLTGDAAAPGPRGAPRRDREIRIVRPAGPAEQPWLEPDVYADETAIGGRVLGDDGEPLEGVQILLSGRGFFDPERSDAEARALSLTAVTDGQGLYAFQDLEPGLYRLRAEPPPEYGAAERLVRSGVHSTDLVLKRAQEVWVFGQVTDPAGEPLEGVLVFQGDRPAQEAVTDAGGYYSLQLALGSHTPSVSLRFDLDGYREGRQLVGRGQWEEQGSVEVNMALSPIRAMAAVTGTLLTDAGEPVAGEGVQLVSATRARGFLATSDARGRFIFDEVPPADDFSLLVRPRGPYRDYTRRGLTLTEHGVDLRIRLTPRATGAVSGLLVDPAGSPIPGFTLSVHSSSAEADRQRFTTDADGHFSLDGIPAGELRFESESYPPLSVHGVHLAAGAEVQATLVLDWGPHRIAGRVVAPNGAPAPASQVWLSLEPQGTGVLSRSTRLTTSDANGWFAFTGVGPGPHRLRVIPPGAEGVSLTRDVQAAIERVQVVVRRQIP